MLEFIREFWFVSTEMAPYLLLGFLVAGLLSGWVPTSFIERHLGGRGLGPVLKASLLGIPLPLCSCGVIPVSASLRQHGASRGATASFLLSTPQTGVDSILVTFSLLGPLFTIYRVIAALVTGVAGGAIIDVVERNSNPGQNPGTNTGCADGCDEPGGGPPLKRALKYGFYTLPRDIGKSLLIGLAVAALIGALVPEGYFANNLTGIWAMLAMMAISIPLYVCATGSVPVAAAFIAAGISPGAALVFLVAGPATNAAAITTVWKILGPKTAITYLATVAVGALAGGVLLDGLFTATGAQAGHPAMFMLPGWFNMLSAIVLLAVLLNALLPRRYAVKAITVGADEDQAVLRVKGMTCEHCAGSVEKALQAQVGVSAVQVDLGAGTATVVGRGFNKAQLVTAVSSVGFDAKAAD